MNYKVVFFTIAALIFTRYSYIHFDKSLALCFANNPCNIREFFSNITKYGQSEYYLIPSFALFLLFRNFKENIAKAALYIFTTVALSGILSIIIKIIVARYRPPAFIHDHLFGFSWFDVGYMVNSFPSGHVTTVFSVAMALGLLLPRFLNYFFAVAVAIALSRVVLSVHYLSDVTAGALLGCLTSYLLYFRFYKKPI